MTTFHSHASNARDALTGARWPIAEAPMKVEPRPGLYAIHALEEAWNELGIERRPGIPLYVGKSERSLVDREMGEHFAVDPTVAARTGSSTLRRSFAALLREQLVLRAVPRNKDKPGHFSNYGLEPKADERLTAWMHDRLTLAVWPMPSDLALSGLRCVETEIIRAWTPPINIRDNPGRLHRLRLARSVMASEAKAWAAVHG